MVADGLAGCTDVLPASEWSLRRSARNRRGWRGRHAAHGHLRRFVGRGGDARCPALYRDQSIYFPPVRQVPQRDGELVLRRPLPSGQQSC